MPICCTIKATVVIFLPGVVMVLTVSETDSSSTNQHQLSLLSLTDSHLSCNTSVLPPRYKGEYAFSASESHKALKEVSIIMRILKILFMHAY